MASAANVAASQARVLGAGVGTAPSAKVSQARVLAAIQFPANDISASQARIAAATTMANAVQFSQGRVLAAVLGRTNNLKLRAWGFSLDGHDFYVLRLGETESIVLDLASNQWSAWADPAGTVWRAHIGLNWHGVAAANVTAGVAWNIIAGDDSLGTLWSLDPNSPYDDGVAFTRKVTGIAAIKGRSTAQCPAVYLTCALANPLAGVTIDLQTSDDLGVNWVDQGTVTVQAGNTTQEISWRSLGLIRAPGRLFSVQDSGATVRISSLDMKG